MVATKYIQDGFTKKFWVLFEPLQTPNYPKLMPIKKPLHELIRRLLFEKLDG